MALRTAPRCPARGSGRDTSAPTADVENAGSGSPAGICWTRGAFPASGNDCEAKNLGTPLHGEDIAMDRLLTQESAGKRADVPDALPPFAVGNGARPCPPNGPREAGQRWLDSGVREARWGRSLSTADVEGGRLVDVNIKSTRSRRSHDGRQSERTGYRAHIPALL